METEATSPSPPLPPGPPPGPPEATEPSPEATEEDPPPPPLPPPRPTRLPCSICKWRAAVLPPVGGGGRDDIQEEPEDEDQYESKNVHTPVHQMPLTRSPRSVDMQIAFHQMPNEVWTDILQTQTLCRGQRTFPDPKGREWTFFDMRYVRQLTGTGEHATHFQHVVEEIHSWDGTRIVLPETGFYTMWHQTPLQNLIRPHPDMVNYNYYNGQGGILRDGFLRHGMPHSDGIGVYSYAAWPFELFNPNDNWALLELKMAPHMTRVKGGSKGRYVLRSGPGEGPWSPCFNVEIKYLWVLSASVPLLLYGGGQ